MSANDSITPLPFAGAYGRQAIVTRFLGPTNTRGSRVKATCSARSLTVDWDHSLTLGENHAAAAYALAQKLGWGGDWAMGAMPDKARDAYVFVSLISAGAAFTVPHKGDA